ncbi:hypothetical protein PSHT_06303, partial [Puccinia striiformis]
MEVNSQATSLALRLGMSTPVPLPLHCLTVPPTDQSSTESQESHTTKVKIPTPENIPRARTTRSQNAEGAIPPMDLTNLLGEDQLVFVKITPPSLHLPKLQEIPWTTCDKEDTPFNPKITFERPEVQEQDLELISISSFSRVLSYEEMMDVCKNCLAEAEMDIMFLRKRAANPMISLATQASTPTPSHQRGQSLPQEDMAMAYQDPAPVQNQLQNHVQHAMKASKY